MRHRLKEIRRAFPIENIERITKKNGRSRPYFPERKKMEPDDIQNRDILKRKDLKKTISKIKENMQGHFPSFSTVTLLLKEYDGRFMHLCTLNYSCCLSAFKQKNKTNTFCREHVFFFFIWQLLGSQGTKLKVIICLGSEKQSVSTERTWELIWEYFQSHWYQFNQNMEVYVYKIKDVFPPKKCKEEGMSSATCKKTHPSC